MRPDLKSASNRSPLDAVREAQSKSSFMETRDLTINRDLTDIVNRIDSKETSNLEASYYWLIQKMQMAVDVPTWHVWSVGYDANPTTSTRSRPTRSRSWRAPPLRRSRRRSRLP